MQPAENTSLLLFHELPSFAILIREKFLNEFVTDQLQQSRALKLPMLSHLTISDDELFQASLVSSMEFLNCLIENRASERIEMAQRRWLENKMGILRKEQITAEDITLASYIQKQSFLKLLPSYTVDSKKMLAIIGELDRYYMAVETANTNTYVNILKERLGTREKQLLEAQALAHIGNWVWDFENKKLIWTEELYHIYGLEPNHPITNEEIAKFNHPDDAAYVRQQIDESNKNNTPSDFVYRIIMKDGTIKYLHARGEIQRDAQGNISKMFGTLQDITKQKEIENELKQAKQFLFQKNMELQQSNTNLEEFAYIASHDLKEPLRKISILGDKLLASKHEKLSENGRAYLTKMVDASLRMQNMINDLLSVSTITGDRAFKKYSLQLILDEVLQTLEHKIESHKAIIQSDQLPEVDIHIAQFRQLFQNLISNTLKFSKKDVVPKIVISHAFLNPKQVREFDLIKAERYLEITIADNGIGFENEYATKIFAIFQRLHGRSEYEGTGIGLSICKKIVENHNGVIYAIGKPGEGATFKIVIPLS
jgi:PAS domain S-box-containing protein